MSTVAAYLYIVAVGFVTAGIFASFAQLVSGKPLRFGIEAGPHLASIGGVLLRVFAGPAILMRNAVLAAKAQAQPPIWLGLSTLIAGFWSLCVGAFVLDVLLRL